MRNKAALLAICLGYFMTILDSTVVNVALNDMQHQLGASISGVQWVVVGYTLAFASLLLTAGTLGERYGNRRIYLTGLAGFIAASLLCGLAPNLLSLQILRVIQGTMAALLVPSSLGLINDLYAEANSRAKAMGVWGAVAGIGAGAGPILGGVLVSTLSWRSIFLLNVPIGLVGLAVGWKALHATNQFAKHRLDWPGQISSITGLALLTFACLEVKTAGLASPLIITSFMASVVLLAIFIMIEKQHTQPMLPIGLFKNRGFTAGNAVGLLLNFAFYGWLFVMSLYFQETRGYSPVVTGLALLPAVAVVFFGSLLSGKVSARRGPRQPMLIGLGCGVAGFLAQAALISAAVPYWQLIFPFIALGFGMSFTMPAMTIATMAHAPHDKASTASGVLNSARQVGGSFGVAILGGLASGSAAVHNLRFGLIIAAFGFALALVHTFIDIRNQAT